MTLANRVSLIAVGTAIVVLSIFHINRALSHGDIPETVVEFAENNVWLVEGNIGGAYGTGTWINNDYMITACHVVSNKKVVFATKWDRSQGVPLKVVTCNRERDFALLYKDPHDKGPTIEPVEIGPWPIKGTWLMTAGYPLGFPLTITGGNYQRTRNGTDRYTTIIGNPGNSGGPVITYNARLDKIVMVGVLVEGYKLPLPGGGAVIVPHAILVRDLEHYIKSKQ